MRDGVPIWMPDNVLLSHGETPHYHRRRAVSLLSSGWDQVVHTRYGRQAIRADKWGQSKISYPDPLRVNSVQGILL